MLALLIESHPIYTPTDVGIAGLAVAPVTAKVWNEPFFLDTVPSRVDIFPLVEPIFPDVVVIFPVVVVVIFLGVVVICFTCNTTVGRKYDVFSPYSIS